MQQRRLRLGDIVDDYCPRERRITNHVVVAMIEDEVKQTRCTTCDADHEYKQARVPAQRRKKESLLPGSADAVGGARRKPRADDPADALDAADTIDAPDTPAEEPVVPATEPVENIPLQASDAAGAPDAFDAGESTEPAAPAEDDGPVHRRLIRATLPRPEGQAPERKLPEFTIHQREVNGNRSGRAHRRGPRPGQMRTQQGNGQPPRFGGQRQGPRHGSGQGGGQGQQGPSHRRKRRR
jgi:hypothetical protein